MNSYEDLIFELESSIEPSADAVDYGAEAMSFVLSLHNLFLSNGMDIGEVPDVAILEKIIESMYGELGAAALFLSENSFSNVPTMLRGIAENIEKLDEEFTDDQGVTSKSVPSEIVHGFKNLAKRIEATKQQKEVAAGLVLKNRTK